MVKAANLVGKISSLCISFSVQKETFIRQEKRLPAVLISKDFRKVSGPQYCLGTTFSVVFSSCSLLVVGSWVRRARCVFRQSLFIFHGVVRT